MVEGINAADLNNGVNLPVNDFFEGLGRVYVDRLMKDNMLGIGIYSCPDFRLLKANQKYSEYIRNIFNREDPHLKISFDNSSPGFKGSRPESLLLNTMKTAQTTYVKELETVCCNGEVRYWSGSLTPIIGDGRVKFIISMINEITDSVLKKQQLEIKNEELRINKLRIKELRIKEEQGIGMHT